MRLKRQIAVNLVMGVLFGWLLSRAGAYEFFHVAGMFAFEDFHLYGVLGVAFGVAALGFQLFKRTQAPTLSGRPLNVRQKPRHPGNIPGSLVFGVGWALTGACPGTSLVQIGSGYGGAILTVIGIGIGVLIYRPLHAKHFSWNADTCG